jgi:SAM-dependent methyltransferase
MMETNHSIGAELAVTRMPSAATPGRQAGVDRLSINSVGIDSPLYLHLHSLFADLEKASEHACGRMLDLGCGNKPYEKMFAGRVSEHLGCDIVQSNERRVDVICPATEIPLTDGSFDTVLCTQVIEHVADHQGLLSEAYRLLKPGGVLIVSAPMYWPLHEEPYDFFRFTRHGLRHLLEKIGFTELEITNNGGKWALCGLVLIQTFVTTRFASLFLTRKVVIPAINRLFAALDRKFPNAGNPINYVVVARKTQGPTHA